MFRFEGEVGVWVFSIEEHNWHEKKNLSIGLGLRFPGATYPRAVCGLELEELEKLELKTVDDSEKSKVAVIVIASGSLGIWKIGSSISMSGGMGFHPVHFTGAEQVLS
ncbi:MAG: hypothetical protein QF775_03720 [archaeon]|nr:hypothetical protein [archaeon]